MGSKHAASKIYSNILKNNRIKSARTPKQLERHFKGVANHRRIEILLLVAKREGITTEAISTALDCNFKTISSHTQRLIQAGLLEKKYLAQSVLHTLSPHGKMVHTFIQSF